MNIGNLLEDFKKSRFFCCEVMDYIPDKFELYEYVAEHDRSHLRSVRHFIGEMERFQSYEAWADLLTTAFKGVEGGRRFYDVLIHDREG